MFSPSVVNGTKVVHYPQNRSLALLKLGESIEDAAWKRDLLLLAHRDATDALAAGHPSPAKVHYRLVRAMFYATLDLLTARGVSRLS